MRNLIPWGRSNAVSTQRPGDEGNPFLGLHRQMDRLFDDFFREFDAPLLRSAWSSGGNWPSIEISEGDKEVKVVAELPGLDEKDIDLSLRDGVLTIKGEKKSENNGARYSERWHGQFARSIDLGAEIDPDRVRAHFDKGVLTVALDKRAEAQSSVKRIAINRRD
ncbi:MAG TPA: Hsp20/alpha crystallin family protein [Rhizomicrobium sp.]|nr:Hsp20/alpha crystallin family protein [Rhizomicrobium sp.]